MLDAIGQEIKVGSRVYWRRRPTTARNADGGAVYTVTKLHKVQIEIYKERSNPGWPVKINVPAAGVIVVDLNLDAMQGEAATVPFRTISRDPERNRVLNDLIEKSRKWLDSLTPKQREAHFAEQAQSWTRQDMD